MINSGNDLGAEERGKGETVNAYLVLAVNFRGIDSFEVQEEVRVMRFNDVKEIVEEGINEAHLLINLVVEDLPHIYSLEAAKVYCVSLKEVDLFEAGILVAVNFADAQKRAQQAHEDDKRDCLVPLFKGS